MVAKRKVAKSKGREEESREEPLVGNRQMVRDYFTLQVLSANTPIETVSCLCDPVSRHGSGVAVITVGMWYSKDVHTVLFHSVEFDSSFYRNITQFFRY